MREKERERERERESDRESTGEREEKGLSSPRNVDVARCKSCRAVTLCTCAYRIVGSQCFLFLKATAEVLLRMRCVPILQRSPSLIFPHPNHPTAPRVHAFIPVYAV